jgi:hypothetical protein
LADQQDGTYALQRQKKPGSERLTLHRIDATTWAFQSRESAPRGAGDTVHFIYGLISSQAGQASPMIWTPECSLTKGVVQDWGRRAGVDLSTKEGLCDFEIMKRSDLVDLLMALRLRAQADGKANGSASPYMLVADSEAKTSWPDFRPEVSRRNAP